MNRIRRSLPFACLTLALLTLAAAAPGAAGEPQAEKRSKIQLKLDRGAGAESIVIEDLHDLALGESRSFLTESGKSIVATRTEAGLELDVDGKTIRLHGPDPALAAGEGQTFVFRKQIEVEGDEGSKAFVWHSGEGAGEGKVRILHKQGGSGEPGAFAFSTGEGGMLVGPFGAEAWIERLRKTESLQQLDAATRETVEQAMREAAKASLEKHLGVALGPDGKVMVIEVRHEEEERTGSDG